MRRSAALRANSPSVIPASTTQAIIDKSSLHHRGLNTDTPATTIKAPARNVTPHHQSSRSVLNPQMIGRLPTNAAITSPNSPRAMGSLAYTNAVRSRAIIPMEKLHMKEAGAPCPPGSHGCPAGVKVGLLNGGPRMSGWDWEIVMMGGSIG